MIGEARERKRRLLAEAGSILNDLRNSPNRAERPFYGHGLSVSSASDTLSFLAGHDYDEVVSDDVVEANRHLACATPDAIQSMAKSRLDWYSGLLRSCRDRLGKVSEARLAHRDHTTRMHEATRTVVGRRADRVR